MAVESPVAAQRATTCGEEPRYLDEHAGTLGSAGRRLALAEDDAAPLRERLRLLADVGRFVDEFFQLTGHHGAGVHERVQRLCQRLSATLADLREPLSEAGLVLCDWSELDDDDRAAASAVFRDRIVPVLSPLIVESEQPLPAPANLSLNVAMLLTDAAGRRQLAVVELPPVAPRFVLVRPRPGAAGVPAIPVEQVLTANVALLFPRHQVDICGVFRVTRRGGVHAVPGVDMLSSIERQLRHERHAPAVRLEVDGATSAQLLETLSGGLGLGPQQVYRAEGLMAMAELASLPLPGTRPPATLRPAVPLRSDMFEMLDRSDMLVHFPYESYSDSVLALLERSSADPALLAIKQTLYRASPDGPTVRALVRAAERGASVVAVVELAARLDESRSVACARALERAGAHVVYGLVGMRTHCPLTLVIRDGGDRNGVSRYGVVGTGLHHPDRRPEGISLLSADPDLTADLADLFNYLTGYSRPARYRKLVVGPHLRSRLLDLIRRETAAGPTGRIALKVYRLVDPEVVDALYRASQRGVRVDLVVSGACALRPGVPRLSERIRVVATLGRHFETSRLFAFGTGESGAVFLSSGDLSLALGRQVDVAVPVDDPGHRARLQSTLDTLVRFAAWEMDADGGWHRAGLGAEDALRELCAGAATGAASRVSGNFRR
ncbi:MAG TPA: polyphosphate kinase [Acidimicrobiia bacterium]|nr:polyphosphate kinase [Acidimicrobiia bacterium]